jgi:hypothetical protein
MQQPDRIGRGDLVLAVIVLLYWLWPYLVGRLALIGAVQLYHVWRNRIGR